MCKYSQKCELYEPDFCNTVHEPHKSWPCYGSDGLQDQVQTLNEDGGAKFKTLICVLLIAFLGLITLAHISAWQPNKAMTMEEYSLESLEDLSMRGY